MPRFASCQIDVDARLLVRDGQPVALEPQAFDVLTYLIVRHERVVSKEELLDAIWGDRWVSESALTTRIKEIRRAVGDTGDQQQIIRTVRGRGYQFVADVEIRSSTATSLVGRDRDLASIPERIRSGSLTTLVGPGGVGKTTLARSLATQLHGRFRDGCLTIDLTVVRSRQELSAVIARAAQLAEATTDNLPDVLRNLDALLVLDDADELVDEVGALCSALQSLGSRLAVLVTCRQRLGVAGEQLWPVLPLDVPDAIALLETRVGELAPLGSLVDVGSAELSTLVASVDCLPLALEMLASASAYLGRDDLSGLVNAHPELLTDPRRDGPARHRSLDALVNDSLGRLDERQRRLLETASVFAGAFDLIDVTTVAGVGPDGLTVARELVDRSLIAPSIAGARGPRFQLLRTVSRALHRTTDSDNVQMLRRSHAQWVSGELAAADTALRGAGESAASERFGELADDARLAHAWARDFDVELANAMTASLQLFAHSRLWPEPAAWAAATPNWRQRGPTLAAVAAQASLEGEFDQAWELGLLILDDPDERVRAWAREVLSDVAIYLGRLDYAEKWSEELTHLGVETGDPRMVVLGTTNCSLARTYAARPEDALEYLDSYPHSGPVSAAPTDQAWLAFSRGEALANTTDATQARVHLQHAIDAGQSVGSRFVASVAQSTLAGLQFAEGDLVESARTHRNLVDTFRRHGIVTHLRISLRNVVPLLAALGAEREALTLADWLVAATDNFGYGSDVDEMLRTRDDLRRKLGGTVAAQCEAEALAMTAAEVSALTVSILDDVLTRRDSAVP